jgi:hypothetical protein
LSSAEESSFTKSYAYSVTSCSDSSSVASLSSFASSSKSAGFVNISFDAADSSLASESAS